MVLNKRYHILLPEGHPEIETFSILHLRVKTVIYRMYSSIRFACSVIDI